MGTLVQRIQRGLLGSAGPEKVKALLAELQIPAGVTGGNIKAVRAGILYSGASTEQLRAAFSIGVTGEGEADPRQAVQEIRNAILRN